MKSIKRTVLLLTALLMLPIASFAQVLSGDVSGGGTVTGSVNTSNAWITSSALDGDAVNFWTLTASAGQVLSIVVNSTALEFGVSVYQGVVEQTELLFAGFNNAGDFGDNIFVAGTNPITGAVGTSLVDILLPVSGIYTIAVGGEAGLAYDGDFAYSMNVSVAPVPLPAAAWLLLSGLLGLGALRRRR